MSSSTGIRGLSLGYPLVTSRLLDRLDAIMFTNVLVPKYGARYFVTSYLSSFSPPSPSDVSPTTSAGPREVTSQKRLFPFLVPPLQTIFRTSATMSGLLVGPTSDAFQRFFIPSVCVLIIFLAYSSQWLFNTAENLEPGPMTKRETTIFNILLVCVWATYYKACTVPPGRYNFPPPKDDDDDHHQQQKQQEEAEPTSTTSSFSTLLPTKTPSPTTTPAYTPTIHLPARWCNKCAAPKPLRAHHCRTCGHCVPKMDHHCPWTSQCVSLQTFPHFLRFLLYTNLALTYLHAALLYPRLHIIFLDTETPSYLGPSVPAITHLVLLAIVGAVTSLLLLVMFITTIRGWVLNQTMIEGWEIERHDAVLARARKSGGYWDPGNSREGSTPATRIHRVEFPYDLSFFENMAQAMGTRNVLAWFDPFVGGHPVVAPYPNAKSRDRTGWEYEENGFNDRAGMWPPPDPDKLRRGVPSRNTAAWRAQERAEIEALEGRWKDPGAEVAAFKSRQENDLRRRRGEEVEVEEGYEYVDSGSGGEYEDEDEEGDVYGAYEEEEEEDFVGRSRSGTETGGKTVYEQGMDGEPGWTNAEGDRLRDYGVDEDAEGDDDEDVPLGELLRRRRAYQGGEI